MNEPVSADPQAAHHTQPGAGGNTNQQQPQGIWREIGQHTAGQQRVKGTTEPAEGLSGKVAGFHAVRRNVVDQHIFARCINQFTKRKDKGRNSPEHKVAA